MAKYDVAIAGAGPGGSYAAKTAAELGLKTVFFERSRKVGEKNASGCGLGQRWWRDFPEIMEKVEKLPSYRDIHSCIFKIVDEDDNLVTTISTTKTKKDAERIMYKGIPRAMSGTSIYRCDLDPLLADLACEAGAELRTSTLVTDVMKENGRVTGLVTDKGEKIEADIVIGADGAHSIVAIKSGIRKRWRKDQITLIPQIDFKCNEQRLDDVIGPAEWVWFGPFCGAYQVNFRDGFHLGLGQWLDIWALKPADMIKRVLKIPAFQAMCRAVDAEMREYQIHMLPWMEKPGKSYADGVMLIGDAGGFPCPLEGEGVWHACFTGKYAAETAAEAISNGDPTTRTLQKYEAKWRQPPLGLEYEYGKEFVALWKNSAFNPEFMKKMVQFLGELQWLNFPSPIFDWSDDHMSSFNDHLGHVLDLLPELSEFAEKYVIPMKRGISDTNREKIANMISGSISAKLPGFIPDWPVKSIVRKKLGLK
ncbi:MAG: NAD(P)/FAD-dependent oxidoreductase [Proteobacteria bacterium]|nr:NAD(P)/FAD-dependent oxidoreductase [Pseudomonadota bacterium]